LGAELPRPHLWDFTDQITGESLNRKIRRNQLSEIQTLVAELLVMERGEKGSKKKRRSSQEQHLHGLENDVEFAQEVLEQTKTETENLEMQLTLKRKEMAFYRDTIESTKAVESEIADVPFGVTDGAGQKYEFSFFERLELWFGNYIKLNNFTNHKTGNLLASIFATFDKITKKLSISSKEPKQTQVQQKENREEGMKVLQNRSTKCELNEVKSVKIGI
jgi:hypothetical protein